MSKSFSFTLAIIVVCQTLFAAVGTAQFDLFGSDKSEPLQVRAYYKTKPDSIYGMVFVEATVGDGYHTYAQNHDGIERPTKISLAQANGILNSGVFKPTTKPHEELKEGKVSKSFDGKVVWTMPFKMINQNDDVENLTIGIDYSGQLCTNDSCLPPINRSLVASFKGYNADLQIDPALFANSTGTNSTLPFPTEPTEPIEPAQPKVAPPKAGNAKLAALYDSDTKIKYEKLDGTTGTGTFMAALIGAFLGGMLLNLMPCVFPVLGLKVLGFVEQAGNDPAKIKMHGIAFAAGLIFSMWILAGAILALKHFSGQEVSWGQQMGNPYFVGGIVILLFVLGLNLAGVFEMGLFLTSVDAGGKKSEGYFGSFFSGVLTTLVATPCSGPFLGAAMGYTLAQPAMIAMLLFTVFGFGIATPYLALSFMPSLIHVLPPPGGWMETFKKIMGFTLFAAAAFFAKSFGSQTGNEGLSWLLMAICVLSLAAFLYGKFSPAYIKQSKRFVWGWAAPILIGGLGIWMYLDAAKLKAPEVVADEGLWQEWVPGTVESLLAQNQPVWVDYTADW